MHGQWRMAIMADERMRTGRELGIKRQYKKSVYNWSNVIVKYYLGRTTEFQKREISMH